MESSPQHGVGLLVSFDSSVCLVWCGGPVSHGGVLYRRGLVYVCYDPVGGITNVSTGTAEAGSPGVGGWGSL